MILPVSRVSSSASLRVLRDQIGEPVEQLAALRRRHRRPVTCRHKAPDAPLRLRDRHRPRGFRASRPNSCRSPDRRFRSWPRHPRSARRYSAGSGCIASTPKGRHDVGDEALERRLLALEAHAGVDPEGVFVVAHAPRRLLRRSMTSLALPTTLFFRMTSRESIGIGGNVLLGNPLDQALADRPSFLNQAKK